MKDSQPGHPQPSRYPTRRHSRMIPLQRTRRRVSTSHLRDITSIVHGLLPPHHTSSLLTCETRTYMTPGCKCPASSLLFRALLSGNGSAGLPIHLFMCKIPGSCPFSFGFYDGYMRSRTTYIIHALQCISGHRPASSPVARALLPGQPYGSGFSPFRYSWRFLLGSCLLLSGLTLGIHAFALVRTHVYGSSRSFHALYQ